MSHTYPEHAPVGNEDQSKPETIGFCWVCGKELRQGSSYTETSIGKVCYDTDCLLETIYGLEGELEEK